MSNENTSIHEFDFQLICEYFSSLDRQGPGSPEVTIKALEFIDNLTGVGTGQRRTGVDFVRKAIILSAGPEFDIDQAGQVVDIVR